MVFKTLRYQKGFTLIELMVSMTIMIVLSLVVVTFVNPTDYRARSRDQKRMSDLNYIDRAIVEYFSSNRSYPDLLDVTRYSDVIPSGNLSLTSSAGGWINADFSGFIPKLPIDPINTTPYVYSYRNNGASYELNSPLENLFTEAESDGGNNDAVYELGNNLTIL